MAEFKETYLLKKLLKASILLNPAALLIRSRVTNPARAILGTLKDLNDVVDGKPIRSIKKAKTGHQFADSFIDNVFKDKVKPKVGSVVHCGLFANKIDHSGIYIGYNKIAHLDGSGKIEAVTPKVFLNRLGGLNMAISIYVSCKDGKPIGSRVVAEHAKRKIGKRVKYNLVNNNCHIFSSGCLTGKFDNNDGFFSELEETTERILGSNEWRVWDIPSKG